MTGISQAKVIWEALAEAVTEFPNRRCFIFIGAQGFEGSHTFADLMNTEVERAALDAAKAEVKPEDLVITIYTSGTTGRPKGAMISHQSQLAAARFQAEHMKMNSDDLALVALPFNRVGGINCLILALLLAKGTSELVPMFSPDGVIQMAKANPPSIMPFVPTMHTLMLMNESIGDIDTNRIRLAVIGASNAEPPLLKKMSETYPNAKIMNLYGLSEVSGAVVLSSCDMDLDDTSRAIGKPIGDTQIRITDSEGKELPSNEIGEIQIKGSAVGPGYFNMPDETAETFGADGWMKTGDLGLLDDSGYLVLKGRLKEMYIQGAFNVYPVEVENVIAKHPKVAMVAGIGVPDDVLGEMGRYYVAPKPGETPTEEEIKAYCKEHLANYKVPKQVVFRQELPLTPVGKIRKIKLVEEYQATGE
jgi:fatty-acyl-CoA synthase